MITHSKQSLELLANISKTVKTFHHHFHVLYDIGSIFSGKINYVEVGCYAGASACLMVQRPNTNVFSIDTGEPISPSIAQANVMRFNVHGNRFEYIIGSSHDPKVVNQLKNNLTGGIDILFIDGGHSYNDVILDFEMYSGMVNAGGYVIFDDYLDSVYSPEVRPAIDKIVSGLGEKYEIIGSLKNDIGAPPAEIKESNCFILKKNIAKIGIVISTYMRPDGRTPGYLNRALSKISIQTFKNYQVYVMGDAYANDTELRMVAAPYLNVKVINLPESLERKKYPFGDFRLWCSGGNNAVLTGIAEALKDGINYICHLNHDDWWEVNHLELINKVIQDKNPFFVCTMSSYSGIHLPYLPVTNEMTEFLPVPGGMITSASCIKYSDTQLRGRDVFEATGSPNPTDADLWSRLAVEMRTTGRKGYLVSTLTCHHDEEGYTMHGKSAPL